MNFYGLLGNRFITLQYFFPGNTNSSVLCFIGFKAITVCLLNIFQKNQLPLKAPEERETKSTKIEKRNTDASFESFISTINCSEKLSLKQFSFVFQMINNLIKNKH